MQGAAQHTAHPLFATASTSETPETRWGLTWKMHRRSSPCTAPRKSRRWPAAACRQPRSHGSCPHPGRRLRMVMARPGRQRVSRSSLHGADAEQPRSRGRCPHPGHRLHSHGVAAARVCWSDRQLIKTPARARHWSREGCTQRVPHMRKEEQAASRLLAQLKGGQHCRRMPELHGTAQQRCSAAIRRAGLLDRTRVSTSQLPASRQPPPPTSSSTHTSLHRVTAQPTQTPTHPPSPPTCFEADARPGRRRGRACHDRHWRGEHGPGRRTLHGPQRLGRRHGALHRPKCHLLGGGAATAQHLLLCSGKQKSRQGTSWNGLRLEGSYTAASSMLQWRLQWQHRRAGASLCHTRSRTCTSGCCSPHTGLGLRLSTALVCQQLGSSSLVSSCM